MSHSTRFYLRTNLVWYIDVGYKWMSVTLCCWKFSNVRVDNSILVTSFCFWCPTLTLNDKGYWWRKSRTVINISKLSRTHSVSNIRHQHRCSHLVPKHVLWNLEEFIEFIFRTWQKSEYSDVRTCSKNS